MEKIILIAVAGMFGTLARYGLSGAVQRAADIGFPVGTLTVNVIGSFLFGLVWILAEERMVISGDTRIIILGGFMGAFTTFSTLMFETGDLMSDSQYLYAGGNIAISTILGLAFLFLGFIVGRIL